MQVANTILEQLGGSRFIAMTGARSFTGGADCLTFKLPRGFAKNRAFGCSIRLDASDTYTVKFLGSRGSVARGTFEVYTVSERSFVYADQLQAVFTSETGLDTRL